jgi:5-methylcytosine-specific restriction endonuclease McrA
MMDNDIDIRQEFEEARRDYSNDTPETFIARPAVRAIMWDKSLGKCWYCGREIPFRGFSVNHIVPRSDGGDESYENLVPCCRYCNHSKGRRSLEEFRITLAKRADGCPGFTPEQMAWLKAQGVQIPILSTSEFQLYFEKERLS